MRLNFQLRPRAHGLVALPLQHLGVPEILSSSEYRRDHSKAFVKEVLINLRNAFADRDRGKVVQKW